MKTVTLNRLDATSIALAQAGLPVPNPFEAEYQELFYLLGEEDDAPHPLTLIGDKLYLPKLYQDNGNPVLQWGTKKLDIDLYAESYSVTFDMVNSGYMEPSIIITTSNFDVAFPVGYKGKDPVSWVTSALRSPKEAITQLMPLDPTVGLVDLSTEEPDYEGPVTVIGVISREGKDFGKGKTKVVTAAILLDGETYKVRVANSAMGITAPVLKQPMGVSGEIGFTQYNGKKFQRLVKVTITEADINTK